MDSETIICLQMDSLFKRGYLMKKDDLDYVYKAMRMDLSEVIDWDKSPELQHYPDPVPYHY